MTTKEAIAGMLVTSTGAALCDSGDAYGRHWQQNQKAAEGFASPVEYFESLPPATMYLSRYGAEYEEETRPEVEINVYHWLCNNLGDFCENDTEEFWQWSRWPRNQDKDWPQLMDEWAEQETMGGMEYAIVNTYNGTCLLSQTLQFLEYGGKVLLQIHQGCDVRGGYTKPHIFGAYDGLYGFSSATIGVVSANEPETLDAPMTKQPPSWYTDDGWNWYPNGNYDALHKYRMTDDEERRGKGWVYVDEDGNGYCPITGRLLYVEGW